jgi:phosphoglycerate dehydrogenase-like enzyme
MSPTADVRKRVAVLDDYQDVARTYGDWSTLDGRISLDTFNRHIADEDELAEILHEHDIVVVMRERTPFGRSLLDKLPRLELLVTTGPFNAAIDLEAAASRGVPVWATRGFLPPTTELTWGLILACAKNICVFDRAIKADGWQTLISRDLHGARLGVIGLGYYGSEVARIGQAFGMDVVAWSQNLTAERCHEAGVTPTSKEDLLATSDFVTLHLLLSERTRGLIGRPEIDLMKPTAFLINASRGPIVDEEALVRALIGGRIAGAGLDVFEVEPLPPGHPLRRLENVVTTPHVGYVSEATYRVFFEDVIDNIACHLEGRAGKPVARVPRRSGPFYLPGEAAP